MMPAYCYTVLCVEPGLREWPGKEERKVEQHSDGIRPVKAEKLCMCCRKRWPLDCGQDRCDCKEQGYLYVVGTYLQKQIGR